MDVPRASLLRRLVVGAALLVPLVGDPAGLDPLTLKRATLALVGLAGLALEAAEVLVARRPLVRPSAPEVLLLLLALWAAASLGWATNPWVGVLNVAMLLGMLGVARTVRASVGGQVWWLGGLLLVGLAVALVDGRGVLLRRPELTVDASKYASPLFVHTNMAAVYAVLLLPVAAARLLAARSVKAAVVWLVPIAALAVYLVVLRSRATIFSGALGLALVLVLHLARHRVGRARLPRRAIALALTLIIVVGGLLPFSDRARGWAKDGFYRAVTAMESVGLGSANEIGFRPDVFAKTIQLAKESPLHGVGSGNFAIEFPRLERHLEERPHGHNDGLQLLAELGAPGLLLFLGLLAATAMSLVRALAATRGTSGQSWVIGLCGTTLVFVAAGMSEVPFTQGASALVLAVLVGLAARWEGTSLARLSPSGSVAPLLLVGCLGLGAWVGRQLPASSLAAVGQEARAAGDREVAVSAFTELAALRTGAHEPEELLSQLAVEAGDLAEALARVRAARRLAPHRVDLLQHEGVVLLQLGRADEAVALFHEAVTAKPGDPDARYQYVVALEASGRRAEAIAQLEDMVRARMREIPLDAVLQLAELWRRQVEELEGPEQVEALIAGRHFFAVVLQDGRPEQAAEVHKHFRHLTHRLQVLPGSPGSWWPRYEAFLRDGGWIMPQTALYTSLDADGRKLMPGWEEPAGPPLPRPMRHR